jgi:hypothetical protein
MPTLVPPLLAVALALAAPVHAPATPADLRFAVIQENMVIDFATRDRAADVPRVLDLGMDRRTAGLVRMLGAAEYASRDHAAGDLARMGWAAFRPLLWGLRFVGPRHAEVRHRSATLLAALLRSRWPCPHCTKVGWDGGGGDSAAGFGVCPASVRDDWCWQCDVRPADGPKACGTCAGSGVMVDEAKGR